MFTNRFRLTLLLALLSTANFSFGNSKSPDESWLEHSYSEVQLEEDAVSLSEFKVTGDGVTDDTNALQAALTHCSKMAKQCVIDQGFSVRVTAPIFIWGGASLIGHSEAKIRITFEDYRNQFVVNLGISASHQAEKEFSGSILNVNFFVIKGPTQKGVKNKLSYPVGGRVLKIWRVNDATISGNYFDVGKYMYAAIGSGRNKQWLPGNLSVTEGLTISNNTISATAPSHGMEGIGLAGFKNAVISGNTIYGVGDDPIGLHNCDAIEVSSNRIASVDGRILIKNSENISIQNNYIARHPSLLTKKTSRGMALVHVGYESRKGRFRSESKGITFKKNHFYYPATAKDRHATMLIQGSSDVTVHGNIFENNSRKVIPAIKITPQIFKKQHPAAKSSQKNRFPIGDTTISRNGFIGTKPQSQVLISSDCADISGKITVLGKTTETHSECVELPF